MDIGYGLGFISCICAEFYRNASVTGTDTFEHASLPLDSKSSSSQEKAASSLSTSVDWRAKPVKFVVYQ